MSISIDQLEDKDPLWRLASGAAHVRRQIRRGRPDGKISLVGCTTFLLSSSHIEVLFTNANQLFEIKEA